MSIMWRILLLSFLPFATVIHATLGGSEIKNPMGSSASSNSSTRWASVAATSSLPITTTATTMPTTTATSTTTTTTTTATGNPITQLATYMWDSMVRMKDGTVQLYTNHQRCNEIRAKQRSFLHMQEKNDPEDDSTTSLKQNPPKSPVSFPWNQKKITNHANHGGITYDEFIFLQKGKEDRGKLANILFMMFFAPNFVPYAFMFFPDMLPSPFVVQPKQGFHPQLPTQSSLENPMAWLAYKDDSISRHRTHVVLSTLLEFERDAKTPSFWANLNPFGKEKIKQHLEQMDRYNDQLASFFIQERSDKNHPNTSTGTSTKPRKQSQGTKTNTKAPTTITSQTNPTTGPYAVMKILQKQIYTRDTPPTTKDLQLVHVPGRILKGLDKLMNPSASAISSFLPKFFVRGKILNHLKQITEADEFLVDQNIDLSTLSSDLLYDACQSRFICNGPSVFFGSEVQRSNDELREGLQTWLDCVVITPRKVLKKSSSSSNKVGNKKNLYYNGNMARVAMLCYYAVEGAKDSRNGSYLPRLLYQGNNYNENI